MVRKERELGLTINNQILVTNSFDHKSQTLTQSEEHNNVYYDHMEYPNKMSIQVEPNIANTHFNKHENGHAIED